MPWVDRAEYEKQSVCTMTGYRWNRYQELQGEVIALGTPWLGGKGQGQIIAII